MYQRGKIIGKIFIVVFCSLKNSNSALKLAKKVQNIELNSAKFTRTVDFILTDF
jgi:hypothetical protein